MNNIKIRTFDKFLGIIMTAILLFAGCVVAVSFTSGTGIESMESISDVISFFFLSIFG